MKISRQSSRLPTTGNQSRSKLWVLEGEYYSRYCSGSLYLAHGNCRQCWYRLCGLKLNSIMRRVASSLSSWQSSMRQRRTVNRSVAFDSGPNNTVSDRTTHSNDRDDTHEAFSLFRCISLCSTNRSATHGAGCEFSM